MTPSEARKKTKQFKVKMNFRLGSKRNRVYPELTEDNQAEIVRKKGFARKNAVPIG